MDEECGEASREAMHHTAIAAAQYDDGDGFDTAAWAAASDDNDATESYVTDRHVLVSVLGDHPRTKLLAVFIGNAEMSFTAAEAADYAGLSRGTVYEHIPDLTEPGLVEKVGKQGNSKLYRLNTDSDAARALAEFEWRLVEALAENDEDDPAEDTELHKGIEDAKSDRFVRPDQDFEF